MVGTMGRRRQLGGFVSGHRFTGCGNTQASHQGIALQAAEKLRLRIRASLYRPRKNSGFVSGHRFTGRGKTQASYQGHRFTGRGKTQASYQGIALQAAEKLRLRIRASLYRPRKNSGFVSGHRFSDAVSFQIRCPFRGLRKTLGLTLLLRSAGSAAPAGSQNQWRLYRLRKNSDSSWFWEGHDFSRANKSLKMVCASAPEVCYFQPAMSFSAACLAAEGSRSPHIRLRFQRWIDRKSTRLNSS